MMRAIKQYEEEYDSNYQQQKVVMRERKAEMRREGYERKVMMVEDYIGTPEGARRLQVSGSSSNSSSSSRKATPVHILTPLSCLLFLLLLVILLLLLLLLPPLLLLPLLPPVVREQAHDGARG